MSGRIKRKATWSTALQRRIHGDTKAIVREFLLDGPYVADGELADALTDAVRRRDMSAYREAHREVRRIAREMGERDAKEG